MPRAGELDLSTTPRRIRQPERGSQTPGPAAGALWLDAMVKMSRSCSFRFASADASSSRYEQEPSGVIERTYDWQQPLTHEELHGRGYNRCWVASWWHRCRFFAGDCRPDWNGHHGGLSLGHRGQPPLDRGGGYGRRPCGCRDSRRQLRSARAEAKRLSADSVAARQEAERFRNEARVRAPWPGRSHRPAVYSMALSWRNGRWACCYSRVSATRRSLQHVLRVRARFVSRHWRFTASRGCATVRSCLRSSSRIFSCPPRSAK